MLTDLFVLFILGSVLVACTNWRTGIVLMIVVGVLQDPIRKMTPGAPGIMAVCAAPVWLATCLGFVLSENRILSTFRERHSRVFTAAVFLACSLVPAVLMVLLKFGGAAWKIAAIGIFGAATPLTAIIIGTRLIRHPRELEKLSIAYCVCTVCMLTGTVLEYFNIYPDWKAVGTETLGMRWIRYYDGHVLELVAGFYRSPDIMGWHASMLVMLSVMLLMYRSRPGSVRGWMWLLPALFGASCLLLSGRRKSILMPVIWCLLMMASYLRGRSPKAIGAFITVLVLGASIWYTGRETGLAEDYRLHSGTDATEILERLRGHSISSIFTTISQSGVFGDGLGVAAQGMQHLDVGMERSWQEGGLARLSVEVGIVGLFLAVLFAFALALEGAAVVRGTDPNAPAYPLIVGCLALVFVNGMSFVVSHQMYNDTVIMIVVSMTAGIGLAGLRWGKLRTTASSTADYPVEIDVELPG